MAAVSEYTPELELVPELRAAGAAAALPLGAGTATLRDYVTLTKPRIMSLLVLTAACAMIAAAGGDPDLVKLLAVIVGGGLACGGASAVNHVVDRDIDRLMGERTASRPVAAGRISPARAMVFAVFLTVCSFAVMAPLDNLLAALLALAGGAFYVFVYTLGLKRRTTSNIVIGGAAGAIPALSGWAAASGHLGAGAWFLFGIVLIWTPPHFWSLAVLLERNYADAKIPMLPVVKGPQATALQVLVYSVVLVVVTIVPGVIGTFGLLYLISAVLLGSVFCAMAWRLWRSVTREHAGVLFHFSLLYLALLFVAAAVGAAL